MKRRTFLLAIATLACTFPLYAQKLAATSNVTRTLHEENGYNRDITEVSVTNDGLNLSVSIKFAGVPVMDGMDKIVVMIDDTKLGGKEPTSYKDRLIRNPATYTKVDASVDFLGVECPQGESSSPWAKGVPWKRTASWTQRDDGKWEASSDTLTYSVRLDYIIVNGKKAAASDSFRAVVFISDYWENKDNAADNGTSHVIDVAPANAVAIGRTRADSDTVVVFFDKALILKGSN